MENKLIPPVPTRDVDKVNLDSLKQIIQGIVKDTQTEYFNLGFQAGLEEAQARQKSKEKQEGKCSQ